MSRWYPCDISSFCPYDAQSSMDCYNHCGLGADEDRSPDEYSIEIKEDYDTPELLSCVVTSI